VTVEAIIKLEYGAVKAFEGILFFGWGLQRGAAAGEQTEQGNREQFP
jgi:hypothetical protein